ncbi:MAG: DUF2948 family protein [Alphaproteobacteria bacterium]|nr:DUF2948 family protein [Alphaproteobacteria bacterium]
MTKSLKLRATDAEDVQVISAVLQDSIVPLCDMAFQPENDAFVMVAQRLKRETGEAEPERICCALTVKGVASVKTQGIDLKDSDRILDLLALIAQNGALELVFAGGAKIRLDLKEWQALIEDFGESWPSSCSPCHDNGL